MTLERLWLWLAPCRHCFDTRAGFSLRGLLFKHEEAFTRCTRLRAREQAQGLCIVAEAPLAKSNKRH